MDIYVLNQDNERLDIIDTYQSAIWHLVEAVKPSHSIG